MCVCVYACNVLTNLSMDRIHFMIWRKKCAKDLAVAYIGSKQSYRMEYFRGTKITFKEEKKYLRRS